MERGCGCSRARGCVCPLRPDSEYLVLSSHCCCRRCHACHRFPLQCRPGASLQQIGLLFDGGGILADANGNAVMSQFDGVVSLQGVQSIIGRSIVVHGTVSNSATMVAQVCCVWTSVCCVCSYSLSSHTRSIVSDIGCPSHASAVRHRCGSAANARQLRVRPVVGVVDVHEQRDDPNADGDTAGDERRHTVHGRSRDCPVQR